LATLNNKFGYPGVRSIYSLFSRAPAAWEMAAKFIDFAAG
jgi:hypothetical protein